MKYLLNSYSFVKYFNYYINLLSNILIIIIKHRYFVIKIPSIFFYKLDNNSYKFLFLKKNLYIGFLKHLLNFYSRLFSFFYFRLKLKGLGYKVVHLAKYLIKIFYNRSNFFFIHIPLCILFKYRSRRLFFISTDNEVLSVFIINILLLKEFVIYRQSGLYYPRKILLIKPGKNKFR